MNLLSFYREQVEKEILPFWIRAFDEECGGVFTCFDNEGKHQMSTDKYVWSQGRYLWVVSRAYGMSAGGKLDSDLETLKFRADRTMDFLKKYCLLPNGACCFLLTREGRTKAVRPGTPLDQSIFADGFVILGFAEYMRVFDKREELFEWTWRLYQNVEERIIAGTFRTEPYPVPAGMKSHSVPMILLNVSQELRQAATGFDAEKEAYLAEREQCLMEEILNGYCDGDGRIGEVLFPDGTRDDTVLARHLNPGHSVEDAWFLVHTAREAGRTDAVDQARRIVLRALSIGWDEVYGGLFRYVDYEYGVRPQGRDGGGAFSKLIRDTWDYKLWWPHSEALYALLLLDSIYREQELESWYAKLHKYVFSTFPNPDRDIGEWIQIRRRDGKPEDRVVALPVKDPYHILRDLFLIIDLLSHDAALDTRITAGMKEWRNV